MIAILHTWGQTLMHHPHAHCLVPGGGLTPDGRWINCRPNFFLPVRVLSRLYRRLFLERLQAAFDQGELVFFGNLLCLMEPAAFARHVEPLRNVAWVVYAKRPFAGPQHVLAYLGRYTHRVAIANGRLLACQNGCIRFRWKDYRADNKSKVMTLDANEFIRRFLLHVLPKGFRRIRHFGFLANACRAVKLPAVRIALQAPEPAPTVAHADYRERYAILTGNRIDLCPICGGCMVENRALVALAIAATAPHCDTS
jgi:Putative transposase